MKKLFTALAVAAGALLGTASPADAAIVLSFTPSSQSIAVNGTASVDVSISGLGSEVLSGFDLNFVWNSSLLSSTGVDFVPACNALGAQADCFQDTNAAGNIGLQYFAVASDDVLAASQLDDFLLGTLTFAGLADGAAIITLGSDLDDERNFVGRNFQSLSVDVGSACIAIGSGSCAVAAVPEPASFALVLLALAGAAAPMAASRRRGSHRQ